MGVPGYGEVAVLKVMPSLVTSKAFGLRNDFRFLLHGSGRKQSVVCVKTLKHPILSSCSASQPSLLTDGRRWQEGAGGFSASFHAAELSVRNGKETNPAYYHAAFEPQTALCHHKLALFIKCIYLAADLLLRMNN